MNRILLFFFLLLSAGCRNSTSLPATEPKILRVMGSETLMPLTQQWAAGFMQEHPEISVHVLGGGTSTGVKALTEGQTEICAASRPLKPDEVKLIAEKYHSVGLSYLVAKDALSIYVNAANPVPSLSLDQVRDLFMGRIVNWKELGGQDAPVDVFVRPPNSGTYLYFKEHVLFNEPQAPTTLIVPTGKSMAEVVAKSIHGIGYGGIAHPSGIRNIKINGIEPTEENARNDRYPITRYLYFYVIDTPKGSTELFINWVQGETGQKIVRESGFISLW